VPGQAPRFPTCSVSSNCPKKPSPVALPRGQSKRSTMHQAIDKKLVHFGGPQMAPPVKEKLQQKGGSSGGMISGRVLSPLILALTPFLSLLKFRWLRFNPLKNFFIFNCLIR